MFKRGRISLEQGLAALDAFQRIPIQLVDVPLRDALTEARASGLYAYDAYTLVCALNHRCPLLTLDTRLAMGAAAVGVVVLEVGT